MTSIDCGVFFLQSFDQVSLFGLANRLHLQHFLERADVTIVVHELEVILHELPSRIVRSEDDFQDHFRAGHPFENDLGETEKRSTLSSTRGEEERSYFGGGLRETVKLIEGKSRRTVFSE